SDLAGNTLSKVPLGPFTVTLLFSAISTVTSAGIAIGILPIRDMPVPPICLVRASHRPYSEFIYKPRNSLWRLEPLVLHHLPHLFPLRSEERRVGKEGRIQW